MPHKTVETSPREERPDRNLRAKHPYKMPVSRRGRERRQLSAVPPEFPAGDEESVRHAAKTVYRPQERIVKRILDDKNIDKRAALRIHFRQETRNPYAMQPSPCIVRRNVLSNVFSMTKISTNAPHSGFWKSSRVLTDVPFFRIRDSISP